MKTLLLFKVIMKVITRFIVKLSLSFIFIGILAAQEGVTQDRKGPLHQKVIDFEGDLVEGMNKKPLDSLNEISEVQKRRKKMHLYRKRKGFRSETRETLREMRYLE